MPESSPSYVTPVQEMNFMYTLMTKLDKTEYCKYVLMKIYHWLKIFHKIELKDIIAEFIEDRKGNLFLFNVVIVDIELPDPKELKNERRVSASNLGLGEVDYKKNNLSDPKEVEKILGNMNLEFNADIQKFKDGSDIGIQRRDYQIHTKQLNEAKRYLLRNKRKINLDEKDQEKPAT